VKIEGNLQGTDALTQVLYAFKYAFNHGNLRAGQ
jgi:hypothetical protein